MTPQGMIYSLALGEIFVFGSNLAGRHGKGAALQARKSFGAVYGIGEGMTGRCYAFPTLDEQLHRLTPTRLQLSRDRLYLCCEENPALRFLLTKVGTGLAGFTEGYMKGLFTGGPENLVLPEDWRKK